MVDWKIVLLTALILLTPAAGIIVVWKFLDRQEKEMEEQDRKEEEEIKNG